MPKIQYPSAISANDFASGVASDIQAYEHTFDINLAQASCLIQNLAEGRRAARLPAAAGQKALERLGGALMKTIEARGMMVDAHALFERDARRHGLQWTTMGPLESKPDDGEIGSTRPKGQLTEPT